MPSKTVVRPTLIISLTIKTPGKSVPDLPVTNICGSVLDCVELVSVSNTSSIRSHIPRTVKMCECDSFRYKRCKQRVTPHTKDIIRICLKQKMGLYANTYHPIHIVNSIKDKTGFGRPPVIDEYCPHCYSEEAAAEQARRKREAEKRAAHDAQSFKAMTPDLTEYMDPFAQDLS